MSMPRALVISPGAFKFSTRARKAALTLATKLDTTFLGLSKVGRTKMWDVPGEWIESGVRVVQVKVSTPHTEPTSVNQALNILTVYVPALIRMLARAVRTPANVIYVNGTSLLIIGLVHRTIFGSTLVLDISERPGLVNARGSVASLYARVEVRLLRRLATVIDVATVVTNADVEIARDLGLRNVHLVRNAPLLEWPAPWKEPPFSNAEDQPPELRAVMMGSIFEGRGYEILIEAVSIANRTHPVTLTLCGPGRDQYRKRLEGLAAELGISSNVVFMDRIDSAQVSSVYLASDVGLVLYEGDDPGNDGLSNKLFECIASGRPVIASDLPENRRFVSANGVGWLTTTTPQSIAEILVKASTPGLLSNLAAHCRDFAFENLNWEAEFEPVSRLCTVRSS